MKRVLTVRGDTGDTKPYEEALRLVGIEPVFDVALDEVAGLVLMGGTDVNPARYGESPRPETDAPDDARDQAETALIDQALDRDMPILAICRGMQMLNVCHGGTLIQHLEPAERHRQRPKEKGLPAHSVEIRPATRLADIAGTELRWNVNSRHHQAVGRLGKGLVIAATDPRDGVIEAIERPDKRFTIGVQWHPENQTALEGSGARLLFEAFAAALD
ncbi:MAG TPA: gamma-glutamyl-gamma-aminobutyrate hydrolase family protein [Bryobacteraceae bacterium]|nr:gamma-glutamyl-gamma-aminobutyrate hydrolase family protein [Bryobacteraceae bacterium]